MQNYLIKNLFYINNDLYFSLLDLDTNIISGKQIKIEYEKWFLNYLKFYLFSNLSNEELLKFLDKDKIRPSEVEKFKKKICSLNIKDLINDYIR